ncbi:cilia- and flagella-associated protein 298-like [Patiria miniata]|uniref:Cilia- and flagella-associated protein 298 n=1 Tax=Patiria miniata TaxID=46514 RepID=A0A913ZBY1_PATMI|nr:cilia- and flagella-associated protein 298-like [Patiria miniata]XP_038049288.1 cilia- and flagella-associated protein 298-like [Patiria miniata]
MVKLHIKHGDESQFLYDTTVNTTIDDLIRDLVIIYNGRLKISRLSQEMKELSEHGISLPPNMQGLADEQIQDLKLIDEWQTKCEPSGGATFNKDAIGRRNGYACNEKMKDVISKTVSEATKAVSKDLVQSNMCLTYQTVKDGLDQLRGAVMIVYPMGLPPHDPIRMEFENQEDLAGSQASLDVLEEANASLWFSGKEMQRGKKLSDIVGKNEKTKIIVKLQKKGQGAPGREPVFSQDEQKEMMAYAYRKQEQMKKLETEMDDTHLGSEWADPNSLKRQFHGLRDVKWGGPR